MSDLFTIATQLRLVGLTLVGLGTMGLLRG